MKTLIYRIFPCIWFFVLFMYCISSSAQITSPPGSGINSDPYRISNIDELKWMRDKVNYNNTVYGDKAYKLMSNLDFTGESDWVPIGTSNMPFQGNFDGNGKVISNIQIGNPSSPVILKYAGLFGLISNGSVSNLGIVWSGVYVSTTVYSPNVGGIVGYNNGGNISNCYSKGIISVSANTVYVGGIAGYNDYGVINNCFSTEPVSASSQSSSSFIYSGGITGQNNKGKITNCHSNGKVSCLGSETNGGGIAGYNSGNITKCYSTGVISDSSLRSTNTGGIAGLNSGIINDCFATGEVLASTSSASDCAWVGGIAGFCMGSISNCYSSGSVSATASSYSAYAGGIAGAADQITNSYSMGAISASSLFNSYSGGIAGWNDQIITNCYSKGIITSISSSWNTAAYAGGIIGINYGGIISQSIALNSAINATAKSSFLKAFANRIGYNENGTLLNNVASTLTVVRKGSTISDMTSLTDFSNINHGANLTLQPLILLNNFVSNTIVSSTGLVLNDWKVESKTNEGFPFLNEPKITLPALKGSGNANDPYLIFSVADLMSVSANVNSDNVSYGVAYYKLMYDLDFSQKADWVPIGQSMDNSFHGSFDGNGKVIKNIRIGTKSTNAYYNNAGLFGYVGSGKVINLGVEWTGIYTSGITGSCLGGIVGYNEGNIVNCYSKGIIVSTSQDYDTKAGGITGYNSNTISNCYSTSDISALSIKGQAIAGGIAGASFRDVSNCYANGAILSSSMKSSSGIVTSYVGGIVGQNGGNIIYCLSLNTKITGIGNSIAYRTGSGYSNSNYSNNFASSSIVINRGASESNLILVTNFSDIGHGLNLKDQPLSLLKNWVSSNTKINGITTKNWKTSSILNNGFPIFEDQFSVGINPIKENKMKSDRIYAANGEIIIESKNTGQIKIFNLNGQLVSQQIATENITKIKATKNGVYIVAAFDRTGKNLTRSQKVIVSQ